MNKYLGYPVLISTSILFSGCSSQEIKPRHSANFYQEGKFASAQDANPIGIGESLSLIWKHITTDDENLTPELNEIPVKPLTQSMIEQMADNSVVKLAHSSVLMKLDGKLLLTDPVFSERASPFTFIGPKRFHKSPIAQSDLPFIDIVIISHNHYDHFDEATLRQLQNKVGKIYVPLGLKQALTDFGFNPEQIKEMDWWETERDGTLNITTTPSQHFSGRNLFDRNQTLWTSWVVQSSKSRLFFSGDSGYFESFKEIGKRLGPFDMTFIENGAYNERWESVHMFPEQAVQAQIDLQGKWLVPIHNSTFKLAFHPWKEPLQRIYKAAQERQVKLVIPKMGEIINIQQPKVAESEWWQNKPPAVKQLAE